MHVPKPDVFKTLHEIISKVALSAASLMLQNILTVNINSKEFSILCPLINQYTKQVISATNLSPGVQTSFHLQKNTLLPY